MGTKEYHKAYYEANKEKWKVYNEPEKHRKFAREFHYRHYKDKLKQKKEEWVSNNFEWNLWSQSKRRAKYSNIEWDLELNDITIPELCPYLEFPLTRIQGNGLVWTNASLDRIDNTLGYVKGNVQVISRLANSMKQHSSLEELKTFAKNVLKLHA